MLNKLRLSLSSVSASFFSSVAATSTSLFKFGLLTLLVFQLTSAVILMRVSQAPGRKPFSIAFTNLLMEVIKLGISIVCTLFFENSFSETGFRPLRLALFSKQCVQMVIPAGLYTLQNNLLFVALANLDVTVFQVAYQLKLVYTVLMSVFMLGKEISHFKWLTLVMLMVGIVLTQWRSNNTSSSNITTKNNNSINNSTTIDEGSNNYHNTTTTSSTTLASADDSNSSSRRKDNFLLGMFALNVCAMSSAVASVYFEKVLKGVGLISNKNSNSSSISSSNSNNEDNASTCSKNVIVNISSNDQQETERSSVAFETNKEISSSSSSKVEEKRRLQEPQFHNLDEKLQFQQSTSLWVRNIQLSIFGFLFNSLVMFVKMQRESSPTAVVVAVNNQNDTNLVSAFAAWLSYHLEPIDAIVWLFIAVQAGGGLLVAAVIKYADNILKGFANAMGIIAAGIFSFMFMDFHPSLNFLLGALIVVVSTVLYSL